MTWICFIKMLKEKVTKKDSPKYPKWQFNGGFTMLQKTHTKKTSIYQAVGSQFNPFSTIKKTCAYEGTQDTTPPRICSKTPHHAIDSRLLGFATLRCKGKSSKHIFSQMVVFHGDDLPHGTSTILKTSPSTNKSEF